LRAKALTGPIVLDGSLDEGKTLLWGGELRRGTL
jgi:hypothetical protein